MKQYRIKTIDGYSNWRNLDVVFTDIDVIAIEFDNALTVKEAEEFFKHYEIE